MRRRGEESCGHSLGVKVTWEFTGHHTYPLVICCVLDIHGSFYHNPLGPFFLCFKLVSCIPKLQANVSINREKLAT